MGGNSKLITQHSKLASAYLPQTDEFSTANGGGQKSVMDRVAKVSRQTIFGPRLAFNTSQFRNQPKNHPKLIYLNEKNHSIDRLRNLPSRK